MEQNGRTPCDGSSHVASLGPLRREVHVCDGECRLCVATHAVGAVGAELTDFRSRLIPHVSSQGSLVAHPSLVLVMRARVQADPRLCWRWGWRWRREGW